MPTIHDFCDKLRGYASYPSIRSKEPDSLENVSFLYALKLESIDQFYWGYTGRPLITLRMKEHLSDDKDTVVSKEAKNGKLLLLLVMPFRQAFEAKQAETKAWKASGGSTEFGIGKDDGEILYYGHTQDKPRTFKHLYDEGWDGDRPDKARVELSEFINLVETSITTHPSLFAKDWNEFVIKNLTPSRKAAYSI